MHARRSFFRALPALLAPQPPPSTTIIITITTIHNHCHHHHQPAQPSPSPPPLPPTLVRGKFTLPVCGAWPRPCSLLDRDETSLREADTLSVRVKGVGACGEQVKAGNVISPLLTQLLTPTFTLALNHRPSRSFTHGDQVHDVVMCALLHRNPSNGYHAVACMYACMCMYVCVRI